MAGQPWRTSWGLVAVLIWSVLVGFPALVFHLNDAVLGIGEHLHAAAMFVVSQLLVYWLAARPSRSTRRAALNPIPQSVGPVAAAGLPKPQVWDAELVTTDKNAESASTTLSSAASPDGCTTRLIIGNYLGSSRSRVVYIEPGGTNHTLLPGQEIEITATSQGMLPSFRIVESDIATQVYVDGIAIAVAVTQDGVPIPRAAPAGQGAAKELGNQR